MPTKKEYTQCIVPVCNKTLGAETRDLDYRVCHEHRECSVCGKELLPIDVQLVTCVANRGDRDLVRVVRAEPVQGQRHRLHVHRGAAASVL